MRALSAVLLVPLLSAAVAASGIAQSSPAPAASALPAAVALAQSRVDTMLRTGHADAAWFSPNFLAQIPVTQVDALIANMTKALGAYQSLEYAPDKFVAHFAKGTADVVVHLDANDKIDGLIFRPASTPATIQLAQSRIDTMLRTGHADAAWFSPNFLAQIPVSQVDALIANMTKTFGAYQSLEYTPEKFIAHFAKGTVDVVIHLDFNEKIDYLVFRPPSTL
jgi:hypothetical protein